jgi:transposase
MVGNSSRRRRRGRRGYSDELNAEAIQIVLDGHRAESVAAGLGPSSVSLLYRWKAKPLRQSGPAAARLENCVRPWEEGLRRVEREHDVSRRALAIPSQRM